MRKHVSLLSVEEPLRAPMEIGFDYTRSLGPVLGEFMTALAGRRILGSRAADGRVHAPPFEYDPVTLRRRRAGGGRAGGDDHQLDVGGRAAGGAAAGAHRSPGR